MRNAERSGGFIDYLHDYVTVVVEIEPQGCHTFLRLALAYPCVSPIMNCLIHSPGNFHKHPTLRAVCATVFSTLLTH